MGKFRVLILDLINLGENFHLLEPVLVGSVDIVACALGFKIGTVFRRTGLVNELEYPEFTTKEVNRFLQI